MKTEKEIRDYLEELKEEWSGSANMNYERGGAIDVLKWILEDTKNKPVIGRR